MAEWMDPCYLRLFFLDQHAKPLFNSITDHEQSHCSARLAVVKVKDRHF